MVSFIEKCYWILSERLNETKQKNTHILCEWVDKWCEKKFATDWIWCFRISCLKIEELEIIVNTEYNTFQVKREINPFACADTWCNVVIVVVVVAVVKITIDQVLQLKANLNLSYVHIAHVLRTSKHSHAHTEAKVTFLYCHTKGTHHYEFVLFSVAVCVCFSIISNKSIELKISKKKKWWKLAEFK